MGNGSFSDILQDVWNGSFSEQQTNAEQMLSTTPGNKLFAQRRNATYTKFFGQLVQLLKYDILSWTFTFSLQLFKQLNKT